MNNPGAGLSATETRKLAEFLQSGSVPANTLTFHQLQGFLFNVCCTPVMLQPSLWLPVVFGNQELEFESEEDSWVLKALIDLYNEINFGVLEDCPRLPAECQLTSEVSDNFKPGSALHEWCSGFNLGIVLTADFWEGPEISDDMLDEVEHIWMFLSFFADEDGARELKQEDGEAGGFEDILPIMFAVLPDFMAEYAAIGRGLYLESLDDDSCR
jgi:yecA family protein